MASLRSEKARREHLGSLVERLSAESEGQDHDALQANREMAMRYYNGELPSAATDAAGEVIQGRSAVICMDVCSVVNATLAVMRDMLILDAELQIDPDGDEDEPLAQAEADICTDVLMKENRGERILLTAIKDGLLMRNGVIKVMMEDQDCVVRAVPPENVRYTAGWGGLFQELPFFAEKIRYTRSDLVDMGIAKSTVWDLPSSGDDDGGVSRARDKTFSTTGSGDMDSDEIECFEAYVLADLDGDGISERYLALVAGDNDCLFYQSVPFIPYAMGSPFISPHRLTGESLFDRTRELQDSNTTMLRQWHDNVAVVNNGRYIYDPAQTSEEDIMTPSAGGGIRARNPSAAVVPLVVPDMTGGIAAAMEFNRRQRSEMAGAALDMASAEAQMANRAATAVSVEKGNQELMSSMIASNFAATLIYGTYRLIHEHLRMYAVKPYKARVRGQAQEISPQVFKAGRRMAVRCGMSPSQKSQQLAALGQHLQLQAQAMAQGMNGVLADASTIYRTSQLWLRGNGIDDPERLAIDPASEQAGQAQQQMAQMQQQQQQQQQQIMQLSMQLEQAKIAEDARQSDDELKFKYWQAQLDAEIEEAKISGQGVIDLEKQRMADEAQQANAARAERAQSGGAADQENVG